MTRLDEFLISATRVVGVTTRDVLIKQICRVILDKQSTDLQKGGWFPSKLCWDGTPIEIAVTSDVIRQSLAFQLDPCSWIPIGANSRSLPSSLTKQLLYLLDMEDFVSVENKIRKAFISTFKERVGMYYGFGLSDYHAPTFKIYYCLEGGTSCFYEFANTLNLFVQNESYPIKYLLGSSLCREFLLSAICLELRKSQIMIKFYLRPKFNSLSSIKRVLDILGISESQRFGFALFLAAMGMENCMDHETFYISINTLNEKTTGLKLGVFLPRLFNNDEQASQRIRLLKDALNVDLPTYERMLSFVSQGHWHSNDRMHLTCVALTLATLGSSYKLSAYMK